MQTLYYYYNATFLLDEGTHTPLIWNLLQEQALIAAALDEQNTIVFVCKVEKSRERRKDEHCSFRPQPFFFFFLDYRRVRETLQMGAAVISAEGQRFLSALVVHLKSVWRTTDCYLWLSVFLYVLTITSNYVRECEWFSEWEKKKVICLYFMYVRNKTRRMVCYRKIINDELILLPLWSVPTPSVLFLLRRSSSPTITFLKKCMLKICHNF